MAELYHDTDPLGYFLKKLHFWPWISQKGLIWWAKASEILLFHNIPAVLRGLNLNSVIIRLAALHVIHGEVQGLFRGGHGICISPFPLWSVFKAADWHLSLDIYPLGNLHKIIQQ